MSEEIWRLDANDAARWIFPHRDDGTVNQYVDFLQVFVCEVPPAEPELLISADTDFVVWMNGAFIGKGQYSNYPEAKTYERFPLGNLLRNGRNNLAVTVFYNGRTSSVYQRGEPGLVFKLCEGKNTVTASGTDTLCRTNPCYHSGPIAIVSGQLAYTFGYDAGGEDEFWQEDYKPGNEWRRISEAEAKLQKGRTIIKPRPVPRLMDGGLTETRLVDAGIFRYDIAHAETQRQSKAVEQTPAGLVIEDGEPLSPAWQMQHAVLSPRAPETLDGASNCGSLGAGRSSHGGLKVALEPLNQDDGVYLVFDLGREEVGHLDLNIDAAPGTIVDIGYGEHLDDGRVRTFVGRRSFAGRYICGAGRRQFSHPFLRWAGRFLQIYVHHDNFALHKLALRRCDYPVNAGGRIDTGSRLHRRIHDVGRRTLHLCMHEHYEDTPWREQALYANDARTQALCGYYAFGEAAMPAASFDLLGRGLRDDGFLNLTAPAKPPVTIPSFTFAWMLAVRDHYLYTGDDKLARRFLPRICSMLRAFLDERKSGLLPLRKQKGIWHFYDWSAGMSGYSDDDFAAGLEADAPLNCYLILALEAASQLLRWCGEPDGEFFSAAAKELKAVVGERFWDPAEAVFRTYQGAQKLTELTQALAVLAGAGEDRMRDAALTRMVRSDSGLAGPGLSQSFYTFEALMMAKEKYGAKVVADIERIWGRMLKAGATTFWETINGASDFGNAGSLCHGWSAVPVYVFYHDVLGVRPIEPGFAAFTVEPLSQAVPACSGHVPTPAGEIVVNWEKPESGKLQCRVQAPKRLRWVKKMTDPPGSALDVGR